MRCACIITAILLSFTAAFARADVTTGLIAWYPFNLDMLDASGNGNHGVPVGGLVATTDRFGTPSGAYEFNGVNSYISIANSTSLSSVDTALTQAAWVEFYGASLIGQAFGPVTMKSASSENAFMYRMLATPAAGMGIAINNWNTFASGAYPFELNQWYHIASVWNGAAVEFYVDGARIDSIPLAVTMTSDTRAMTIGGDVPGILEIFYGKIDDVRLYTRALTGDDVRELCSCGPTAVGDTPPLRDFSITRVFPNPTEDGVRVDYTIGSRAPVELSVYDVTGRVVRRLYAADLPPGDYSARWDGRTAEGREAASGVYFVRLRVAGADVTTRAVRLR
jgi:hypothetical protein